MNAAASGIVGQPGGDITRSCWSPQHEQARAWRLGEIRAAGLQGWVDAQFERCLRVPARRAGRADRGARTSSSSGQTILGARGSLIDARRLGADSAAGGTPNTLSIGLRFHAGSRGTVIPTPSGRGYTGSLA